MKESHIQLKDHPIYQQIRRYMAPPLFPNDRQKAYQANLLNALLFTILFLTIVNALVTLFTSMRPWVSIWFDLVPMGIIFVCLWLMRRNHIQTASILLTGMAWVGSLASVYTYGIRDHMILSLFVALVLATLLLGKRGTFLILAANIVTISAFVYAGRGGFLPELPAQSLASIWRVNITIYIAIGVLLYHYSRAFENFIARVNISEQTLKENNRQLQLHAQELKKQQEILQTSETRYRAVVEGNPDMICRYLPDTTLTFANEAYCQHAGQTRDDLIGTQFLQFVSLEAREAIREQVEAIVKSGQSFSYERQVTAPNGEVRWQYWSDRPIVNESGQLLELQSIGRDITVRKRAEEQIKASLQEKEVLLKEIHHRVKNNLQVISSLLDLQAGYVSNEQVQGMFQDSRSRVRSMALVHEQLYQAADLARIDMADYIQQLTGFLFRSYGQQINPVDWQLDIDHVFLSVETAVPLGLIINELVSNALKHAFVDGRSGQIRMRLWTEDDQLYLTIRDDGIGFPDDVDFRQSPSLGLTIIMTLVNQLQGQIELSTQDGTCFELTIPTESEKNSVVDGHQASFTQNE
ncbi:sensor histidine kinase [Candidatus Leptofilum sp.]|uniref:sensor histidine kinase n=1 Tax=Candidatus Leptofilum sp. TaxID=3241576 RepID=UPI003B5AB34C